MEAARRNHEKSKCKNSAMRRLELLARVQRAWHALVCSERDAQHAKLATQIVGKASKRSEIELTNGTLGGCRPEHSTDWVCRKSQPAHQEHNGSSQ
jgi:hypothetical protein